MTGASVALHADFKTSFDLLQHRLNPVIKRHTLPPSRLLIAIHTEDLKYVLGQVDPMRISFIC